MCEDYPCCGHTPSDPCERQWYDEPGTFDTSVKGNEHALCDHENGDCDVDYDEDDGDDQFDSVFSMEIDGYWPEDQWLDGSYEE